MDDLLHERLKTKPQQSFKKPHSLLEDELETYLDSFTFEDDNSLTSQLCPPNFKRNQLRNDVLNAFENSTFNIQILNAFTLLKLEGVYLLGEQNYNKLMAEFRRVSQILPTLTSQKLQTTSMQELLQIEESSIEVLHEVEIALYQQERYADCVAVSILHLQWISTDAAVWYRTAIAAQQIQQYDLALEAYAAALQLDPSLLGCKIFTIQCNILQGKIDKARIALEEAKISGLNEGEWQEALSQLELWLKQVA